MTAAVLVRVFLPELLIEHEQGITEITVYNRAILLFTTDIETERRIHQSAAASRFARAAP